jgi:hypothetical protein
MKFLVAALLAAAGLLRWDAPASRPPEQAVVFRLTSADPGRAVEVRLRVRGRVSLASPSLRLTGDTGRVVTPVELTLYHGASAQVEGPLTGPALQLERLAPAAPDSGRAPRPPRVAREFKIAVWGPWPVPIVPPN